jgi:DNA-binding transcriptional ArsR family regulator
MALKTFPLEKIFGSRTRVKIITLFTTGVKRPYFVREITRTVNERLNAVRRELMILEKIGMLSTYEEKRRKYYTVNESFPLYEELASIMKKVGPAGVEDALFKHIDKVGEVFYACVSGYFTGSQGSPTDLFIIGNVDEKKLEQFAKGIESQIDREISYTPMTLSEYEYRVNFKDMFLRIFGGPHKELVNMLPAELRPEEAMNKKSRNVVRDIA